MDEFEIDVKVKVRAASARAGEEFVEGCLAQESAINPALEVVSIRTVGSVQNADESWRQSVPGSTRPGQKPGFW